MKNELGLTVSIGISFNKIFAKLGSDMKKPDAITKKAIFDRATEEVNKQLKRQMILYKRRIKELELQIELLEEENQRLKENR